ncbi:histidine kinase [Adhaeribacter arboris]|uniref:histidine kinase n=1 Tax=Adhaeribacter arboris TaxID=2072846 RepID=A0A2T2YMY7_9BACT|nr:sensor histidine kinase [Adhaeribacter arboris]PSR56865.1 histidine kinase [Adhaeribacter arboris]
MKKDIIKIKIENELDVVLSYKRSLQLAQFCGLPLASQTKFATAVSEICRNVLEHVGHGQIAFNIVEKDNSSCLEALVSDRGRGITNLEQLLDQNYQPLSNKGWGIYNSKKLVQLFIESTGEKGTQVKLHKAIPPNQPPISKAVIQGWIDYFTHDTSISPYAEIKHQNMQLLELLDQLRQKNLEVEEQLQEIKNLNIQLEASNQEIHLLLQERNKVNEKLTTINQELDKFAYTVSHDLKSPLFNIFSLASVLEEEVQANNLSDLATPVSMLKEQAQVMEKFISDVLEYSTAGRYNVAQSKVNLNALINKILLFLAVPTHFEVEVASDLPTLLTEEIYLQQVFSNLISNAIKYNDKPKGRIQISCHPEDGSLHFSVTDNGPGIPLHDQENIFKPYQTGSKHRNTSTGLGLSIVSKIIESKQKAFWVESNGTNGTIFHFTWPLEEVVN